MKDLDGCKSRIKERTLQEVIQKVSLWRLLYTGFYNKGVFVKMSLEEAAQKVEISKKSLDDYLMQLRSAKKYGFDFKRHAHEKVGVIRAFVRQKKDQEKPKNGGKKSNKAANVVTPVPYPETADKTPRRLRKRDFKAKCVASAKELFTRASKKVV